MNIRDLEYFLKICELGSFNMAAKQLYITPQGLSNVISKMEQELSCSLFYRGRGGTFLTAYGSALRPYAEQMLACYSEALSEIDRVQADENGVIRLGCAFGAFNGLVMDFPIRFQEKYPQYKVSYSELPDKTVEEQIEKGDLDIGFTGNPDVSRFKCIHVSSSAILFVAHSQSRFYDRKSVSITEICDEPLTLRDESFATTKLMLNEFEQRGVHPNILFNTGGIIRSLKFCRNHEANTIILEHLAGDFTYDEIRMIPFEEELKWSLYMIAPRDREPSLAVSLFMSYIERHL